MSKKLRILMNTNGPWCPSGYANQAAQLLPLMAKEGYETACIAFYGLEGGIINLDGVWYYPRIASQWGDDAMIQHSKHFNADVVFTLQDIWTVDPKTFRTLHENGKKWIPIVPIDHEPIPPGIHDRLRAAYRIVSYSPFGYRELKRVGLHSTYIPHTTDTSYMKKLDKAEMRKQMGIPEDVFLFGMVAANKDNPPRKSFQHVMDSFKEFHDRHPKSAIYFHSMPEQHGGFNIKQYASYLGITNCVYHADPYEMLFLIQTPDMARIYSAMDCLLAPAQNEGFGIPLIEAAACEVPVITTDFTAMRDLVLDGKTGYKVKVLEKRFTPLGGYVAVPDWRDLLNKMERVYVDDREKMGKEGRKFVVDNFDLNLVWETKWKPFLSRLEEECYPLDTKVKVKDNVVDTNLT
jgi:glycosyltransferase involved in cell wall biosynthesis